MEPEQRHGLEMRDLFMTFSDKLFAFLGFLGLVIFNAVILIWVAEPDLILLVSVGLMLAAYDFWRTVFSKSRD